VEHGNIPIGNWIDRLTESHGSAIHPGAGVEAGELHDANAAARQG
jgi:hypothetical protein